MLGTSKIYSSNNYGDFRIVKYVNSMSVEIQFLDTGYKYITQSTNAASGNVKDKLLPSVFGIGFVGAGKHQQSENGKHTKQYRVWVDMLRRCYSPKYHKTQPTYTGCSVCKDWRNFQNFAKWFECNYIEGFHIDKDLNQQGVKGKVYSPETCSFITQKDNTIEALAKHYKMRDPKGVAHEIYNMSEFCRKNGLTRASMSRVCLGKQGHHKGWTKA